MEYATKDFPANLARLPDDAGCYIFKAGGKPLYVGKAKSLRKRVSQYFAREISGDPKTAAMLARATAVELIVTATEAEALLLEMNLIQRLDPQYNVTIHGFPYIKVTREKYPQLFVTREGHDELTGRYIGPFTDAKAIRRTVALTVRAFRLRTCKYELEKKPPRRPCLDYEMGKCLGPCLPGAPAEDYAALVERALRFIVGRRAGVRRELERRMAAASARLAYEDAAAWRDVLKGLNRAAAGQYAVVKTGVEADAVACEARAGRLYAVVLRVREGRLVDRVTARLAVPAGDPLEEFLLGHYGAGAEIPKKVFIGRSVPGRAALAASLATMRGGPVAVVAPKRGEGAHLVGLANKNLQYFAEAAELSRARRGELAATFAEIGGVLGLKAEPRRFEMTDISNTGPTAVVGSLVVFQDGVADRASYRRYRIRTVTGQDDLAAVAEVASRRFARLARGDEKAPDVFIVDGGPNQLAAARAAAEGKGPAVTVAAFAKDPDRLYMSGRREAAPLGEAATLFLARVRDEAHRFAAEYHRKLRGRTVRKSLLDEIAGIGPARKRALLRHFGSVAALTAASADELAAAPRMTRRVARALWDFLHGARKEAL